MGFNRDFEINEEQIAEYLSYAANKVKTQENVDTLDALTKLFKKNVPLTLRKYVIAYLLKETLKHNHSYGKPSKKNTVSSFRSDFKSRNEKISEKPSRISVETDKQEEHVPHQRVIIAPEDATSIFISIGRNRRVYPRDLVGLLIGVGGLSRDRIGDIKVLANYSFIQLYTDDTQQAIEKLNGYEYRGRKLTVSYSKQKEDSETDEVQNSTDEQAYSQDSGITDEMAAEDAAAYAAAEKAAADKEPFGNI